MHWRWPRGAPASSPPALLLVVLVLALVSDCAAAAGKSPSLLQQGCLPLEISREAPRRSAVVHTFKISFKVSAPSRITSLFWRGNGTSAAVALTALDSGIEYGRASVFPPLRPRQSAAVLDGGQTLLWEDVRLAGLKGRASYSFKTKVKVLPCAPPVVRFRALLQQSDGCVGPDPVEWTINVLLRRKDNANCGPTPSPTISPTRAPTELCGPGRYFDTTTGGCAQCAPGTYWNSMQQTTACLVCPLGETSLQGATQCFAPCPSGQALDTTTLTCIDNPPVVSETLDELGIPLEDVDEVFIANEPSALADTLGLIETLPPGSTVVVVLDGGVYPVVPGTLNVNLVIAGSNGRRRRRLAEARELQAGTVIYAADNGRHFSTMRLLALSNIVLQGSLNSGVFSGGVELTGTMGMGSFSNVVFRDCRWSSNGGAVAQSGGASSTFSGSSTKVDSCRTTGLGGGVYADGGNVTVHDSMSFINNSAPVSGGGAIYLAGATLDIGSNVLFSNNTHDDITTVTATVLCLNTTYTTGLLNCSTCSGSYVLPSTCPVCSATSPSTCTTCPQSTYGGPEAEIVCQFCPVGYTTVYPQGATSSTACVPITTSPTFAPTFAPGSPTPAPTPAPTAFPTSAPSAAPNSAPTTSPSAAPTESPSSSPTTLPSATPTFSPGSPTPSPTSAPTTTSPSAAPTGSPASAPSAMPTAGPTFNPTSNFTLSPSASPSASVPSAAPTGSPASAPSAMPTAGPTFNPTSNFTLSPSASPSASVPSAAPTGSPTSSSNFTLSPTAGNHTLSPTAGNYTFSPTAGNFTLSPTAGNHTLSPTAGNYTFSPTAGNFTLSPTAGNISSTRRMAAEDPLTCCSAIPSKQPAAFAYSAMRTSVVSTLVTSDYPSSDTWHSGYQSFNSMQAIGAAPTADFACALRQQTLQNPSKAATGVYWQADGIFNGMLFKDFVLNGFELAYTSFMDSTPDGGEPRVYLPSIRIQTRSPGTGRYSDFIWDPNQNQESQGAPSARQGWLQETITEAAGANLGWPSGPTGGWGWSCTLGCYFPFNAVDGNNLAVHGRVARMTFRSLETYVKALLDQPRCSEPRCSIDDAIITGVQVVLGPDTPNAVAYTRDLWISSSSFGWEWKFGCTEPSSPRNIIADA